MKLSDLKINRGNPLLMGATVLGDSVNFALTADLGSECELVLYKKNAKKESMRIPFESAQVIGNVYAMEVEGLDYKNYDYNFCIDGEIVTDIYAKAITGKKDWGVAPKEVRGAIISEDFDWEDDAPLRKPFDETIMYRLHVRGFTKDATSKVRHKGTYLGVVDKIPHLKRLGITMVELMPAYDFNEIEVAPATSMVGNFQIEAPVLNYWGYTNGFAFAPKASFAFTDKPGGEVNEFKTMVKALHDAGIEVSMEFFFPEETKPKLIIDALRYWVMEYHIDGVHINGDEALMKLVETDNILSTTKIFTYSFAGDVDFYQPNKNRNLANFNDGFMVDARKFVKGDEDMLNSISYKIKANPPGATVVNYVANHNTFTLYDCVSYDRKYNEENGENNNDGAEYNYSWNCGAEGETRKRTIMELRKKQIKNMLSLVFLSAGVPMIYAGDEMCNSQKGNNNPYCLDNETSWTNWNNTAIAKETLEFVKELIDFRKKNKVLHMSEEARLMDHKSYGLPDLSYHGVKAWAPDFSHLNRFFGAMYCGAYAKLDGAKAGDDLYIVYNMYWMPVKFSLPNPGKGKKWKIIQSTDTRERKRRVNKDFTVKERSIVILRAE